MSDTEFIQSLLTDLKRQLGNIKQQSSVYSEYEEGYLSGKQSELESIIELIEDHLKRVVS